MIFVSGIGDVADIKIADIERHLYLDGVDARMVGAFGDRSKIFTADTAGAVFAGDRAPGGAVFDLTGRLVDADNAADIAFAFDLSVKAATKQWCRGYRRQYRRRWLWCLAGR